MQLRSPLLCSTFALAATFLGGAALAADLPAPAPMVMEPASTLPLPAVSGLNGKLAVLGGGLDSNTADGAIIGGEGSVSLPIGQRFGFQADGVASAVDGELVAGGYGHLFWRDPAVGLVGAYGGWATNDLYGFDAARVGLEGEAYLGRFSFEAVVGWEHQEFDVGGDDDNIFALADLAFYVTDDLRFSAGYRHWNDIHMGAVGMEYQLPWRMGGTSAALFAEGRFGEDNFVAGWGGLRFYFGAEPKPLIRRHREDDPRVKNEDNAGQKPTTPTVITPPVVTPS